MYPYSPLSESKNEIRLLHLQPGEFNEDIRCSLQHARLTGSLDFTALSYTWGDPKDQKIIFVDGHTINVTINLWDALHYMRNPVKSRIFWIDAVCINQHDLAERSKQVLRMHDIYTMATVVEVWLGKADIDGTDAAAMDLVRALGATIRNPDEKLAQGFDTTCQELFLEEFEKSTPEIAKALSDLFKRPWWTRVWVVQELSLAKQDMAIVRVGQVSLHWLDFLIAAYAIELCWFIVDAIISTVFLDERLDAFQQGIRMAQCRKLNSTDPLFTLLELLHQHRDCQATDPRDKVFGLLGLAGDVEDIGVKPDYTSSAQNIYVDMFKKHVTATGSLDMICACRYPRNFQDLPSWVPDWSTDQTVPGICINERYVGGNSWPGSPISQFQKYAASGNSTAQVTFSGDTLAESRLSIAIIPIGKVTALSNVDSGMQFEDLDTFGRADENGKSGSDSEIFNQWLNMVLDSPIWNVIAERYGIENVLDAFCRTIVGDRNNRMMKPPKFVSDTQDDESDNNAIEDEHVGPGPTSNDDSDPHTPENDEMEITSNSSEDSVLFSPAEMLSMTVDGFRAAIEVCWGKRLAIFDSGYIGLVQQHTLVGDIAVVALGCTMPLVLRPMDAARAKFIAESYVHSLMDGEAMKNYTAETINLE